MRIIRITMDRLQNYYIQIMSSHQIEEAQSPEVAGFIAKTFQILSSDEFGKIIYWAPSGREFVIKDVNKFQQIVLPRFFRHSKMNSFIRQLNMYGFHKSRNQITKSVFSHPLFQRDRQDLLITIKRKIKGKVQQEQQKTSVQTLQTPLKKRNCQTQQTTTGKQLAQTGRELRSTRQFSFGEQANKVSTFNYIFGSKERLGSRMNLNLSMRKLSSREANDLRLNEDSECVSIEEKIDKNQKDPRDNISMKFMNPSCFFTSIRK